MGKTEEAKARYRAMHNIASTQDPVRTTKQQSQNADDAKAFLWIGRILHVDVETMVCSIQMESGQGIWHDVPLPAPGGGGPRSWSGVIPEQNSRALIGWKKYGNRGHKPYIITYWTVGTLSAREFEPSSAVDPNEANSVLTADPDLQYFPEIDLGITRLKSRKAYAGDWIATASGGAHAQLDRDAYLTNRANNEFRLRDSDQTSIHQTVNEFITNAAGYYRRGLIKRNAYNFQLDLALPLYDYEEQDFDEFINSRIVTGIDNPQYTYLTEVDTLSPAYSKLREFELINEDGTPVFPNNPDDLVYPYVVTPDGQRISYVVRGEHETSFTQTNECYVEDRVEMRHVSDGIMAVTEEGDGFQIDRISPVFIEDVKGTIVGNDPYTEAGRKTYKRVVKMRVFEKEEQSLPSNTPVFEPIDTLKRPNDTDTVALARLFRVQCPAEGSSSNQYAFGISKEGQVFLHLPKATVGETRGRSLDANIMGAIKAIFGSDGSRKSIDLTTSGGIRVKLGTLVDNTDPDNPENVSADFEFDGVVRLKFNGPKAIEKIVEGSETTFCSQTSARVAGDITDIAQGGSVTAEGTKVRHIAGDGGYTRLVGGDSGMTHLGKTDRQFAQNRTSTFAVNDTKLMLAGVDSATVIAGSMSRTVTTGSISHTVATGSHSISVGVGNASITAGTGNVSISAGAGNASFAAGAGAASVTAGAAASLVGGTVANVTAPLVKIGTVPVGVCVAGVPGPPGPHLDYVTGLPIRGIPTIAVG